MHKSTWLKFKVAPVRWMRILKWFFSRLDSHNVPVFSGRNGCEEADVIAYISKVCINSPSRC